MQKEYAIKLTGVITIDDLEPEAKATGQFGRRTKKRKLESGKL